MERMSWKNFLEGLGVLALVASLLFVGFQLQQDRNLAAAQVIVNAQSATNELFVLISDNRDVWLRGLKGEELSAVDEIAFRAVAVAVYQRNLGFYQRLGLLGFGTPENVARRYAFDLYQYPSLRRIFMQEEQLNVVWNRYFNTKSGNRFIAKVMEYLVELDEAPPELPDKTFFPY